MSLFNMSVFNVSKPLGPCLVQALYCVALVMIALGLARGIVGGVRMMSAPAPIAAAAIAGPEASAAMAPAAPGNPPAAMPGPSRGPRFGFRDRGFRGPPFSRPGFMIGGGLLRGMPAPVLGIARILGALFVALVLAMVVRVLAEIANAILAMGARARS